MSDEDERIERLQALIGLLRGIHEDTTIAAAEEALANTSLTGLPMPDTAHPAYASNAAGIRSLIVDGAPVVRVPRLYRTTHAFTADEKPMAPTEPLRTLSLSVRKIAGPAPFVGDPREETAWYVWRVAIDNAGRHVAGPAELHWKNSDG